MIIKITQAEVRKLVGTALNLNPDTFNIEITDCAPLASKQATDTLQALRLATLEVPQYQSTSKFACIKRFRDLAPRRLESDGVTYSCIGLADAKWAVENVDLAIRNLEIMGKLR